MSGPWRQPFEAALLRNAPQRELQVATVSPEGVPAVRTVTLRGMSAEGFPWFFTDTRTRKADHLRENPRVALHAWFPASREQFRLSGRALLQGTHAEGPWVELRQQAWAQLGEVDRLGFVRAPPGSPLVTPLVTEAPALAPPEFLLVAVEVTAADWLAMGPPPTRVGFRRLGSAWVQQALTP